MYQASAAFHEAVRNGAPQIPLLVFSGRTFTDEDIDVDTGIEFDDNFNMEENLAIGQAVSNEIRFTLFNDDGHLNEFPFGEFKAWLGAQISGSATSDPDGMSFNDQTRMLTVRKAGYAAVYEMVPLGVFIADRPNVPDEIRVSLTCFDRMQKFDEDMPGAGAMGMTYPATIGTLFTKLCQSCGVPYKTATFINSGATIAKEPEQFENATKREVLGWIAEAAGSIARFNRDGQLELAWVKSTDQEVDESGYVEFKPYWYETKKVTKLHNRSSDGGYDNVVGSGTEAYLIQDNPLLEGVS